MSLVSVQIHSLNKKLSKKNKQNRPPLQIDTKLLILFGRIVCTVYLLCEAKAFRTLVNCLQQIVTEFIISFIDRQIQLVETCMG